MKIIDLLNKIANKEEVPEIIEFDGTKYYFRKIYEEYYRFDNSSTLYRDYNVYKILNEEVEIIEEDKEIEEIIKWGKYVIKDIKTNEGYTIEDIQTYIALIMETQNEIIDRLDELKKGK